MIQPTKHEMAMCRHAGFSLIELMVALAILGILIASAVPSFQRSMEQSRADIAGANLYSVWSAQRLYWLENRTFAESLSVLESEENGQLVASPIVSATSPYQYTIDAADSNTFTATATRSGGGSWEGSFTIDQTGVVTGSVTDASRETVITPAFQD